MTVTVAQFRLDFPEFGSLAAYPNSGVNFWLTYAYKLLSAPRWNDFLDLGAELFTAHNLALEDQAKKAAATGGTPGVSTGAIASQSVGDVSVSYDTGAGLLPDAGHWNLTIYGTRFLQMVNMFGAGPVQVGGTWWGPAGSGAYAGPWVYNVPNPSNSG